MPGVTAHIQLIVHDKFEQIYATSGKFSWTNAKQFQEFCRASEIKCEEVASSKYFKDGMCDGAFLTEEYTYDAKILQKYYEDRLFGNSAVTFLFHARIDKIVKREEKISLVGLGYVGMPIAVAFARKADVIGFDLNKEKVKLYQAGVDPTNEVGDEVIAATSVDFTSDETRLKEAKFHSIWNG